jgi:uncharacterized membrane protein
MRRGAGLFEEMSGDRTRVEGTVNYPDPPGGAAGEKVAGILCSPQKSMRGDLRNFKGTSSI